MWAELFQQARVLEEIVNERCSAKVCTQHAPTTICACDPMRRLHIEVTLEMKHNKSMLNSTELIDSDIYLHCEQIVRDKRST